MRSWAWCRRPSEASGDAPAAGARRAPARPSRRGASPSAAAPRRGGPARPAPRPASRPGGGCACPSPGRLEPGAAAARPGRPRPTPSSPSSGRAPAARPLALTGGRRRAPRRAPPAWPTAAAGAGPGRPRRTAPPGRRTAGVHRFARRQELVGEVVRRRVAHGERRAARSAPRSSAGSRCGRSRRCATCPRRAYGRDEQARHAEAEAARPRRRRRASAGGSGRVGRRDVVEEAAPLVVVDDQERCATRPGSSSPRGRCGS